MFFTVDKKWPLFLLILTEDLVQELTFAHFEMYHLIDTTLKSSFLGWAHAWERLSIPLAVLAVLFAVLLCIGLNLHLRLVQSERAPSSKVSFDVVRIGASSSIACYIAILVRHLVRITSQLRVINLHPQA